MIPYKRADGFEPKKVDKQFVINLLGSIHDLIEDKYEPRGLFFCENDEGGIVAIDNSTGDAWVEVFGCETMAISWLMAKHAEVQP